MPYFKQAFLGCTDLSNLIHELLVAFQDVIENESYTQQEKIIKLATTILSR